MTTNYTSSGSTFARPSTAAPPTSTRNSVGTPGSDDSYTRTSPGYDPKAPLLPRSKGDVEPLYNGVQRLKEQQGMTDKEAVNKILRDAGEIP